ncbi:MAG TPA: alkaline phosphatase family protein, partial [Bradyrhizobium sp.]|nr:alkaline phosphatase family protein [Bradyrhizobium sp.]
MRRDETRVVVIGFDGLRQDLVTPELTPNICALQRDGVTFVNQRAVYPSETRVIFTSLVSGLPPSGHGIVGNKYLDRASTPARYCDTADAALLESLDAESSGGLVTAPTLGQLLAMAGRSAAVLSTDSGGATRILHHRVRRTDHVCVSGHDENVTHPAELARELIARFGALPPSGHPDLDGQVYLTRVFLEHIWPKHKPDLTMLWYSEPDLSSHFSGTGAAQTLDAIALVDAQFGRILDWWHSEGRDDGVQLLVLSDHGHITGHTRVSVASTLEQAGITVDTASAQNSAALVIPGQAGAIYLRDN